jgi:hypothetical protein
MQDIISSLGQNIYENNSHYGIFKKYFIHQQIYRKKFVLKNKKQQ